MELLNIDEICDRKKEEKIIIDFLNSYNKENKDTFFQNKKSIYIYGDSGIGKTTFILNILKKNNYDIIYYNSGDIRNKNIIETITKHNMTDKSILTLFNKTIKRPVIVMDEIDGMILGDKGGINSLIKLLRPKKNKKQKNEYKTLNPIICIGNYQSDKKNKELIKICHSIELKKITNLQINIIMDELKIDLTEYNNNIFLRENIYNYVDGNLKKMKNIYDIYINNKDILMNEILFNDILYSKSYNYNINNIIIKLLNHKYDISQHIDLINETDRTIIGLNYHENIIDNLKDNDVESILFYIQFLENICFSDYIDRITFQKQIWQFNEMSSLIKIFKNNKLFHESKISLIKSKKQNHSNDIRFTKVLTKYSTEYNNFNFIQNLCQQLMIDKKDLFSLFIFLKIKHNADINKIFLLFENYDISKLDINRIYKYIDSNIKDETNTEDLIKEQHFEEQYQFED
jgi:Cdc6-like AAA superfamily ATPase